MKFKVDSEACQSAGTCLTFTNEDEKIYEFDDENKAEILTASGGKVQDKWVEVKELAGVDKKNLKEAEKTIVDSAKGCPFNAIVVEDGGKQIWPEKDE